MKAIHDITVLVAEDERSVRMLLRVVLEAAGARVLEAEDGDVALRLLDLHPEIDLLCTDVNMPRMDGEQLVLAARCRRPDLPVVACSAMSLPADRPGLASVADAVVQKPFVPAELMRAIDAALARSRRGAVAAS